MIGAEIDRPSESSTVSVSSVRVAGVAWAERDLAVEKLIPLVQQFALAPLHDRLDSMEFLSGEPTAPLQADGIELELRLTIITLDMGVWRFVSIVRMEEESLRPNPEDGWHDSRMVSASCLGHPTVA